MFHMHSLAHMAYGSKCIALLTVVLRVRVYVLGSVVVRHSTNLRLSDAHTHTRTFEN